jgi:hypothetical protein
MRYAESQPTADPGVRHEYDSGAARRAFFVGMLRKRRNQTIQNWGSHYLDLMRMPREQFTDMPMQEILNVPYATIGGVGTRLYSPERVTHDIDVLIRPEDHGEAVQAMLGHGGERLGMVALAQSTLGLEGEHWRVPGEPPIDIMWANAEWVDDAVRDAVIDETGLAIAPLWAITLMKLDAARSIDQGDLGRMLGLASDSALAEVRRRVARWLPDAVDDLEAYIYYGKLDTGVPPSETR